MNRQDTITLTGITAIGYHGVFGHEKRDGQPFVVDAVLHADLAAAAAADDLTKTAHYGEVAETIAGLIRGESFDLIETLAVRTAEAILGGFPNVEGVEVTVHKPKAPIQVPFGDVSIRVFRDRAPRSVA
ncbi:dihydroneopterin aldolase [Arthrobacter livingstonensis]|uniref:7,8-dihydroneopterin aldolase n=1 Tax=Arthrobacter livingstonensis TaxID=670078 RepID=A0A2V5L937_9MICC|nr:dihydroneopterin aldolase [Arthrobacter livingstonensis]PYI66934.1 dihydroneopterin aldolase [Arthrobacter livingstonensis]